jgi:hypothetical protein
MLVTLSVTNPLVIAVVTEELNDTEELVTDVTVNPTKFKAVTFVFTSTI